LSLVIRSTAQTSFALFMSAFVASPLVKLWPGGFTRWLRANRRYLGVSFAASHTFHVLAITALAVYTSGGSIRDRDAFELAAGALGYVFIYAMAITSFDRTARWLGARGWKTLHTIGAYYIWVVFMFSYGGRAYFMASYRPAALALVAAVVLRVTASRARKVSVKAKAA
ncbi:MAG TPA: hypothetical protein VJQ56_13880, partial [Blastocatellia bacterium]|nr:hypothetical protein [Blastocatellia bacterium]